MFASTKEEKYYYIQEILSSTPRIIFKNLQKHQADLETMIKQVNPNVVHVDFDADFSNLLKWDELEKVKQMEDCVFGPLSAKELDFLKQKTDQILGLR